VSYEYAACQEEKKGVLMMSSYVGAIKTLPVSSIVTFNPWDTPRFAEQINATLLMGEEEREKRHKGIMKVVDTWTRSVLSAVHCPLCLKLSRCCEMRILT
jgi:trehalose-6-phosphate synthase